MFTGITAVTFEPVLDGVVELLPIVLPAVIGFIALRKGIAFMLGAIRGA